MSPMQAEPMTRKAVPWIAVRMRKAKKAARLGASAEPALKIVKRMALVREACRFVSQLQGLSERRP